MKRLLTGFALLLVACWLLFFADFRFFSIVLTLLAVAMAFEWAAVAGVDARVWRWVYALLYAIAFVLMLGVFPLGLGFIDWKSFVKLSCLC